MPSGWLPWLAFNVPSDDQGNNPDGLSVSAKDELFSKDISPFDGRYLVVNMADEISAHSKSSYLYIPCYEWLFGVDLLHVSVNGIRNVSNGCSLC